MGREFAPDDQVSYLEESAFLCKDLDRVAAVLEDASVAVDVADFGGAGNGVHVAWVVASHHFTIVG